MACSKVARSNRKMAVWSHLEVTKSHVAYACVGVFSAIFSLVSLFAKEKLYIGESTVAVVFGLIVGPHCLDWFNPIEWGNTDSITLEITRIVLCLQIFAVAVELPKKYMLKHWLSVTMLLLPVMTAGWLILALFVWIVIPHVSFPEALLVASCVTATDPILAQSVVSGKFAQRVPGHLRNLLTAESGCNDGMAFPFIYLSLNLLFHSGHGGEIVKDWICVTILYECLFGCILGAVIGYTGRRAIKFAEEKKLIDRESFLAFYVVLAFICAGFGSMLSVDDLLVSFAAGTAFAWDGWFSKKTKESEISTIIDLLLNLAYFVYFGAIIPWQQFNDPEIGTNAWRLVILAIVVIVLRRIPAVLAFKAFIPDIKSWREALFVGHFGPIGVGAVFAAILARSELEGHATGEETPLKQLPEKGSEYWRLIALIWPMTCFFIVVSIIVHGSSVAVITLGRHLNTITLTKSFTTHTTNGKGNSWMQRLPSLDKSGRSFSLQRIDTKASPETLARQETVETSGVPAKPAGGMKRKRRKLRNRIKKDLFRSRTNNGGNGEDSENLDSERLQREKEAQAAAFALSAELHHDDDASDATDIDAEATGTDAETEEGTIEEPLELVDVMDPSEASHTINRLDAISHGEKVDTESLGHQSQKSKPEPSPSNSLEGQSPNQGTTTTSSSNFDEEKLDRESQAASATSMDSYARDLEKLRKDMEAKRDEEEGAVAYAEGNKIIVENKDGEIIDQAELNRRPRDEEEGPDSTTPQDRKSRSRSYSINSLKRALTPPRMRRQTLVDEQANKRYFAYKIDDQLIIENDDGDVLRRYKINPHAEAGAKPAPKRKPTGVVAKALSAVGLSKGSSRAPSVNTSGSSAQGDVAQPQSSVAKIRDRRLTPVPTSGAMDVGSSEDEEEESEEDGSSDEESERAIDDEPESASDYDGSEDGSYTDEGFSDEEPETAIERARRLTALGHVSAPRREDDEEFVPGNRETQNAESSGPSNKVKSALSRPFRKQ